MDYNAPGMNRPSTGLRLGKKGRPNAVPPTTYNPYEQPMPPNSQLFDDTSNPDIYGSSSMSGYLPGVGPNTAMQGGVPLHTGGGGYNVDPFPGQQFLNDPMMANMAMTYGQALVGQGKEIVDKKIEKYVSVSKLKYYFAVDTSYVAKKLGLLLFPFSQTEWSVRYSQDEPVAPRYEVNAPDLYIPVMSFVTYILVTGYLYGIQNRFSPEKLGVQASSAMGWLCLEILSIVVTIYVMRMDSKLKWLDLLAFCSYKYVGMILSLLGGMLFKMLGYYVVLLYMSVTISFFLMRTLRLQLLPEQETDSYGGGSKRRMYLLLFIAVLQPIMMYWLTSHLIFTPIILPPTV